MTTVQVTSGEFDRWQAKLAKLNARAVRRGFTGRLELAGERIVVVNRGGRFPTLPEGAQVVIVEATITGDAPCYGSWRLLAALDALPCGEGKANWVVRYAPGYRDGGGGVDREALRYGWCDHCQTDRPNRRHLYAVQHTETGEVRQVGSSCVKDFTGWSVAPVIVTVDDVDELLERFGGWRDAFTPSTVVTVAVAAVEAVGWVSRSASREFGRPATCDLVQDFLAGAGESARQARELLDPLIPAASVKAAEVIAAVIDEYRSGTDDYAANLYAALCAESVEDRQFALVCSAVSAHRRIVQLRSEPAEVGATHVREWFGQIGERVAVTGTVRTAMRVPGYAYNTDQMLLVVEAGPILVKAYSGARWVFDVRAGDLPTVAGIVKAHDVYAGKQQTVLTRIKRAG